MFSSLENKVPHFITFPNYPLSHVSPCVIRCTCFVHNVSLDLHKLLQRLLSVCF